MTRRLALALILAPAWLTAQATATRPMTWLDVQNMRQVSAPVTSPDGRSVLYTVSVPDWKEARRETDIYVVNTQQGVPSTVRLTYSGDKNETSPAWSRDGQYFAFLSDRDAAPAAASAVRGSEGRSIAASCCRIMPIGPDSGSPSRIQAQPRSG